MPTGFGPSTQRKQADLADIARVTYSIGRGAIAKGWPARQFLVLDLCAGCGRYAYDGQTIDGSPLVFERLGPEMGLDVRLVCCERDPSDADRLTELCGGEILRGDHADTVPPVLASLNGGRPYLGLAYWDPNGAEPMPLELFTQIAEHPLLRRVDFMAAINANGRKRPRGLARKQGRPDPTTLICDEVAALAEIKGKVLVRDPEADWQATFIFATDYAPLSWRSRGFVEWTTPEGQAILARLDTIAKGSR